MAEPAQEFNSGPPPSENQEMHAYLSITRKGYPQPPRFPLHP
jgi:hypothetical protein